MNTITSARKSGSVHRPRIRASIRPPETARTTTSERPPVRDQGHEKITTATYNLAGGNSRYGDNFQPRTSDLVAEQMVHHGVDVMSMQEVAINTANGNKSHGPLDYNREILQDVFAQTYGLEDDQVKAYYVDRQGQLKPINTPESQAAAMASDHWVYEGGGHSMEVTAQQFDRDGNPLEFQHGGHGNQGITVYRAQLDNGEEYNSIFADSGSKSKDGQYGNAVLLGPGLSIRDEQGQVIPGSLRATQLGTDPELWKSPDDREKRTAVGVRFTTPEGQTATAFSAHLSTESIDDSKAEELIAAGRDPEQVAEWQAVLPDRLAHEQQMQMHSLEVFTREFGGDRNVIVGGDFNQRDLTQIGLGQGSLQEPLAVSELDHQLVSPDIQPRDGHWVQGDPGRRHIWDHGPWFQPQEYSDHRMLVSDLVL